MRTTLQPIPYSLCDQVFCPSAENSGREAQRRQLEGDFHRPFCGRRYCQDAAYRGRGPPQVSGKSHIVVSITSYSYRQVQISLDVKNMLLHQERRGMAEWITSATFKRDYETAINLLTPGTGQWLLEHENFIDWYLGRHPVLWCHGHRSCILP